LGSKLTGMKINWKEYIVADEEIEFGKPVIKGTRITVDFIMGLLASGWTVKDILKNYPKLRETDIQAVFAFIFEGTRKGFFFDTPKI